MVANFFQFAFDFITVEFAFCFLTVKSFLYNWIFLFFLLLLEFESQLGKFFFFQVIKQFSYFLLLYNFMFYIYISGLFGAYPNVWIQFYLFPNVYPIVPVFLLPI